MLKNNYYNMIKPLFDNVVNEFLKEISNYHYEIFRVEDYEVVLKIEDAVVFYIGLRENYATQKEFDDNYVFFDRNVSMLYHITIEELLPNEIFNFNASKFCKQFSVNTFSFFNIKRFSGWNNPYGKYLDGSACEYINNNLPNLKLKQKFQNWSGWSYYFLVFEFVNDNKKAYCLWHTTRKDIVKTIRRKFQDLLHFCLGRRSKEIYKIHIANSSDCGIKAGQGFNEVLFSLKNFSEEYIRKNVKYYIVEQNIKDVNDIENSANEILRQAYLGVYNGYERGSLELPPTKWKSEYLVKEICEKLYGKDNVWFQYKPFFLQTEKGQLSYDIYLIKQKIAVEYQGKQHFEPVEFFGGQEHFEKQVVRDKLKKKLSKENGVKLVYINYDEIISEQLIKERIEEKS